MGILSSITKMTLGLKGKTPNVASSAVPSSKLHNTSSTNNVPELKKSLYGTKPMAASELDLNASTPKQYLNDLPI